MHEASLVGMHATRYSRLSAVCNDWVYYVCAASYTILAWASGLCTVGPIDFQFTAPSTTK